MSTTIHPGTTIGATALIVPNLDRSLTYYQHNIGLQLHQRENGMATLGVGGLVCVTSDGIAEAFNPQGEQYGIERIADLVTQTVDGKLDDMNERLKREVRDWERSDDPRDDQTLVIAIRR